MSNSKQSASIVALPSVSSALHTLPHATSIHNVHIHQHMYAQRAAESEAKLQKALSKTAASQNSQAPYQPPSPSPSSSSDDGSILFTKTKSRFTS